MRDEAARSRHATPTAAAALDAAFAAAPVPLAVVGDDLVIVAANAAFEPLAGGAAAGASLLALLPPAGPPPVVPAEGDACVFRAASRGSQVDVHLSRRGGALVAAVLPRDGRTEAQALLTLGREVAAAQSEEALVAAIAKTVRAIFPGRAFCVRIVDPKTIALTALYAEGKLVPGAADVLRMRRSSARHAGLEPQLLAPERVELVDEVRPIFEGARAAMAVPLVSSGQLFGLLDVEHGGAHSDPELDDRALIQIANTASVGIRNAKLIDELTFVRKYLEDLIEHANALILVTNRERRILVFNRELSRLSGYDREEVLGNDFLDFVPEAERKRLFRVIARSLKGKPVSNLELRLLDKQGEEKRVVLSTAAVLAPNGEVEGVIAIGQDLTQLKTLEGRVIQAEKLASLGQLAAGVVHEINNPLTAIVVSGESLRSRYALDPAAKRELESVQKIVESGQRILRFTRDLMSYARPSSDRLEPIRAEPLLDAAVSFCEHVIRDAGANVVRRYEATPAVAGMRNNLEQVFVNLITNACHALGPKGTIELVTRAVPGGVEIEIHDDGAGIEPRLLERIFEPFFSTKPDGKGTGLGLSIVQGIVSKHGGTITVESALGRGTAFRIRLPEGGEDVD